MIKRRRTDNDAGPSAEGDVGVDTISPQWTPKKMAEVLLTGVAEREKRLAAETTRANEAEEAAREAERRWRDCEGRRRRL